jgi:dihydrolipoamide dehydrogenase
MEGPLGIRVLCGKPLEEIQAGEEGVKGRCGGESLAAEMLLVAVGRQPVTDGLNVEQAGLKRNGKGFLEVDEYGRTSAAHVFAVGDVNGGIQLAHNATSQGLIAAENAVSKKLRRYDRLTPSCIFTAPEAAAVGLSETEAEAKKIAARTGKFSFGALGKALASGQAAGFVKWIADAESDRLLGAAAVGPHATELIAEAGAAIRAEMTARELGRTMHAHPTLSEAWMEAAHVLHGEAIHHAPRRRG